MKRLLTVALVALLVLGLAVSAGAQDIGVIIDGQQQSFDPAPVNVDGRILVPMRGLFEALGADVKWEGETRTAVGVRGSVEVRIPIGSKAPTVNGEVKSIDVPAKIIGSYTFIPLRFVGEALGDDVGWDKTSKAVTVARKSAGKPTPVGGDMAVHFIDVGQGDSILIQSPAGKVILVDAGPRSAGQKVVEYLAKAGITSIDIFVATHAHEDHIGGFAAVAGAYDIGKVYDTGYIHTSKTYENLLTTVDQKGMGFEIARAGGEIAVDPALDITILGPVTLADDANNNSIVLGLTHGQVSVLLTGDAEAAAEQAMLTRNKQALANDILKVGHHGSNTSTTDAFLSAVSPEIAVIMCGAGNSYGHPHSETLDKLVQARARIYRTDLSGDIVVRSDGVSYKVSGSPYAHAVTPKEPAPAGKVNINTAGLEELQKITGVGPVIAENIISYRNTHGPFARIEQIMSVSGIGEARLEAMKDEITVG